MRNPARARYGKQRGTRETDKKIVMSGLVAFVYVVFLALMFPTNTVQSQGTIVNIFAHYFGIFFGLIGFLIMEYLI